MQRIDLRAGHARGELQRRQAGAVQDLVRECVAHAREQARIGQGALQGVILAQQRLPERRRIGIQDLQAAAVVLGQPRAPRHQVQRRAPRGARLGEHQRAGVELKAGQPHLARNLRRRVAILPAQAAGDHQVDHQEQIATQGEHDALAEPLHGLHPRAVRGADRRIEGAQHERVGDAHTLQRAVHGAAPQVLHVHGYRGQFRHGPAAKATPPGGSRQGGGQTPQRRIFPPTTIGPVVAAPLWRRLGASAWTQGKLVEELCKRRERRRSKIPHSLQGAFADSCHGILHQPTKQVHLVPTLDQQ